MVGSENKVFDTEDTSLRRVSLICSSCGGALSVDKDSTVLMCPFCGAKELILESESVEIEKIRSESLKEIELEKIRSAERIRLREHKQLSDQKELDEVNKFRKSFKSKLLVAGFVISGIFSFLFFVTACVVSGLLALAQALCFGVAWAMGMRIIKGVKKHLHSLLVALAIILILPVIFAVDITYEYYPETDWNIIFLNDEIPEPQSKAFEIHSNTTTDLWIDIHNVTQTDYYKYLSECKALGYTNEVTESTRTYKAFNEDGCCIELTHSEYREELSLMVNKPADLRELNWAEHTVSKVLPEPPSYVGLYQQENAEKTEMIVGEITGDEFIAYCKSCKELGFTIEEAADEHSYSAFNEEGYGLSLRHTVGNRRMEIVLNCPLEFAEMAWPENGIAALLPEPPSLSAKVDYDIGRSYAVYVDNIPKPEYDSYVQKCIDAGFNKDISRSDISFRANSSNGEEIRVYYKGNEVVYIAVSGEFDKDYYN